MKKIIIVAVVLIITSVGGYKIYQIKTKPLEVKTEMVKRDKIVKSVTAIGLVKAGKSADLSFNQSGKIVWLNITENDQLATGAAIAQLDREELRNQVSIADANVVQKQSALDQVIVTYHGQETSASKEVRRQAEIDLEKALKALKTARYNLEQAVLYVSFSGIVTSVDVSLGEYVTAGKKIAEIVDPETFYFSANIEENDLGNVKVGQKVNLSLEAYPDKTFSGVIYEIPLTSSGVSSGTTIFSIRIKKQMSSEPNNNFPWRLGMTGKAEIIFEEKDSVLTIPFEAIKTENSQSFVFVIENNKAVKKEVNIGLENDEKVEILSGINDNQEVIISEIGGLKEGQNVAVHNK